MRAVSPQLLERLMELALVDVDVLVARLGPDEAQELLGAFVADLEAALAEARALLRDGHRELTMGQDPLALLDLPSERRAGAGDEAIAAASTRLAERAAARRELARLEEVVRALLPRLLLADRRLVG